VIKNVQSVTDQGKSTRGVRGVEAAAVLNAETLE